MISPQLQFKFHLLEMSVYETWLKADPKEREKITKELGEYEGKEIIKEINKEAEKLYGKI